jgi:TonB family protein
MKTPLLLLSIALFLTVPQGTFAQKSSKPEGTVNFRNKEISVSGEIAGGMFTGTIVFVNEPLAFDGTIALNTSLHDYAVGFFLSYDYAFTGTMIDWLPTKGVLNRLSASSPLYSDGAELEMKSAYCNYTYKGKRNSFRIYPKSFLDIFRALEDDISGGARQNMYDLYLKGRRFTCDLPYDGAIRRTVSLYFSKTGDVAKIWKNYLSAEDIDMDFLPKQRGTRLCPACGGKGAVYDINGRFQHYCGTCAGTGVVSGNNEYASFIEDVQTLGLTLAFYDSMYTVNEKGEKVYTKDKHGEEVYNYQIIGNKIIVDNEEYELNPYTGSLVKGDDVYESVNISEEEFNMLPVSLDYLDARPKLFKERLKVIGFYDLLEPTGKDLSYTLEEQKPAARTSSRELSQERSLGGSSSSAAGNRTLEQSKPDVKSLSLKGGKYSFEEWFNSFRKYPQEAREKGIQGTVVVQFYVYEDGHLGDASIVRSADPILSQEVLRVLKTSPRWEPVIQNGKPTKTKFEYSTRFSL